MERWRELPEHTDYLVSSEGRIKNKHTGLIRKQRTNAVRYPRVNIVIKGVHTSYYVHVLVARLFLPDYSDGCTIRFIDENFQNCRAENLRVIQPLSYYEALMYRPTRVHAKRVKIVELDMIFRNTRAAARHIGGDIDAIGKCLRGEQRHHKGYTFMPVGAEEALEYLRERD